MSENTRGFNDQIIDMNNDAVPDTYDGNYGRSFYGHQEGLFDQNEDAAGEIIDPRTGLPIDNATSTDETIMREIGHIDPDTDVEQDTQEHELPKMDAADAWLAEHDVVSLDADDFPPEQTPERPQIKN